MSNSTRKTFGFKAHWLGMVICETGARRNLPRVLAKQLLWFARDAGWLAALCLMVACAAPPEPLTHVATPPAGAYHTARYGVAVDDQVGGVVPREWVDDVIDATANSTTQVDPDDTAKLYAVMAQTIVHIIPMNTMMTDPNVPCTGDGLMGCTLDPEIWIEWRPCLDPTESGVSIFAHEMGHRVGHGGHTFAPWFEAPDTVIGLTDYAMCLPAFEAAYPNAKN